MCTHYDARMYCSYADNITIIVEGKFLSTLSERRQIALKIAENLHKDEKLSVNPKKTVVVPFRINRIHTFNHYL